MMNSKFAIEARPLKIKFNINTINLLHAFIILQVDVDILNIYYVILIFFVSLKKYNLKITQENNIRN